MKRAMIIMALVLLVIAVWANPAYVQYATKIYRGSGPNGGDTLTVASGGQITVQSGGTIDLLSGANLDIAGTQMTSSAAELNQLDGVTAGAAAASKAVVLDSGKRVTGMVAYIDTSHADGDTLTAAESGKTIAHYNSIKKTLVLPPAAAGLWNEYIVDDGDSLVIDANASDKIVDGTTEYEKQTTVAGTVKLKAVDGTYWYMVGATGTWTGY